MKGIQTETEGTKNKVQNNTNQIYSNKLDNGFKNFQKLKLLG